MNANLTKALSPTAKLRPHAYKPLLELIEILATERNPTALEEFLWYRTVFSDRDGERKLLLMDRLKSLLETYSKHNWSLSTTIWEEAHDLTLDKFTQLPDDCPRKKQRRINRKGNSGIVPPELDGVTEEPLHRVDRRKYYAALLKVIQKDKKVTNASNVVEREAAIIIVIDRYIKHQFFLSLKEAKRRLLNPFVSRYTWRLGKMGSITVLMPKYIEGRKRGMWLRAHVGHVEPSRQGERERVQAIINAELAIPTFADADHAIISRAVSDRPSPRDLAVRNAYPDFVEYFANEKATRLETLRSAIRKRGEDGVKALVRAPMENALSGEKRDCAMASEAGLAKATFSRFAGSEWGEHVPDLWRNVAVEISRDPIMREAAEEAGVYKAVAEIAGAPNAKRKGDGDES